MIGNPLIMKEMAKHAPDARSYAPVTVLLDELGRWSAPVVRQNASLLTSYDNPAALEVARSLDTKVEALMRQAAS